MLNEVWKKIKFLFIKIKTGKNLFFLETDVVILKLSDESYRAMICVDLEIYGEVTYIFALSTYNSFTQPNLDSILKDKLWCTQTSRSFTKGIPLTSQSELEKIWNYDNISYKVTPALVKIAIQQSNMSIIKDSLEKIGTFNFKENFKETGTIAFAATLQHLENNYAREETSQYTRYQYPLLLFQL